MSKANKYDVFISCGRSAIESARTLIERLKTNGFVSSPRALDCGTSSSVDEVIQDFYQSAVCVLVYGELDDAPWYDGLIGKLIKRRAERSRGEFRVISVLSAALRGWKQKLDLQHQFIDLDSVIEYAAPFDDAAKFRELVLLIRGARQTPHKFFSVPRLRQWIVRRAKNALNVDWSSLSTMSLSPPVPRWSWIDDDIKRPLPLDSYGTLFLCGAGFVRGGFPDLKRSQSKRLFACSGGTKLHGPVFDDLIVDSILRSQIQYWTSSYGESFRRPYNTRCDPEKKLSTKSAALSQAEKEYIKLLTRFSIVGHRVNESVRLVQPNSGALGTTLKGITFGAAAAKVRVMMPFHVDGSYKSIDTTFQAVRVPARLRGLSDFYIVFKTRQPWDCYDVFFSTPNSRGVNVDKIQTFVILDLPPDFDSFWSRFELLMLGSTYCLRYDDRPVGYGSSRFKIIFDNYDAATVYRWSGAGNESPPKVERRGEIVCKSSGSVDAKFFFSKFAGIVSYSSTPDSSTSLPQSKVSYDGGVRTGSMEVECFGGVFREENTAPVNLQIKAYSFQGRRLRITENDRLFELIGTTYSHRGYETFALPDLRGQVSTYAGQVSGISQNYRFDEQAGIEHLTLVVEPFSKCSLPTTEPFWEAHRSQQDCGPGRSESVEIGNELSEPLEVPLEHELTGVGYPAVSFEVRADSVMVVSQWHSLGNAAGVGEERIP